MRSGQSAIPRWSPGVAIAACLVCHGALAGNPGAPPNYGHDFVTVGAPGNRAALESERVYGAASAGFPNLGAVNHSFRIARTEMTATQWLPFVNAFTRHWDAMGRSRFDSYFSSEIIRPGNLNPNSPPAWQIEPGAENRAITAGWRMMAYYCNWLHNGRPEGDWNNPVAWEAFASGAYDASTFTQNPDLSFNDQITRSAGAKYWIPSLDEWTKAAHYDPNRYGPGEEGYWTMMAGRNTPLVSGLAGQGGETSAGTNFPAGFDPRTITVGSYPEIMSPWGLLDTSGGQHEWTEAASYDIPGAVPGVLRGRIARGSRAFDGGAYVEFDFLDYVFAGGSPALSRHGFRIASAIPSPGSALTLGACVLLASSRRRRTSCSHGTVRS